MTTFNVDTFPYQSLRDLLPLAFAEDEGSGDITSIATIEEGSFSEARLIAKERGVVAGLPVIEEVFAFKNVGAEILLKSNDGSEVSKGDLLALLKAPTRAILSVERLLLNFLQRMSGIATQTHEVVQILKGSNTKILDTRKTLPGFRMLDKYSVRMGGASNHRQGLFDMILIKDNHIKACGSVANAVEKARASLGSQYLIEAEVETLSEFEALLNSSVDIIMFDNMTDEDMITAIKTLKSKAPHIKTEASGNMNIERIKRIADIGLDYISVGSITHSVKALDISLDF